MLNLGVEDRPVRIVAGGPIGEMFYEGGTVAEAANRPFRIEFTAISEAFDVALQPLLGEAVTLECRLRPGSGEVTRHFNGYVVEAAYVGGYVDGSRLRFVLEPFSALALRSRRQRVFKGCAPEHIVETVLGPHLRTAGRLDLSLGGSLAPLEYTVQYGESDWNFVCRIMERYGLNYHFEHRERSHTLVLTDRLEDHDGSPLATSFDRGGVAKEMVSNHFTGVEAVGTLAGTATQVLAYDFKEPKKRLETKSSASPDYAVARMGANFYPGPISTTDAGRDEAVLRLDEERGRDEHQICYGAAPDVAPGRRIEVLGNAGEPHRIGGEHRFVCIAATHHLPTARYGSQRVEGFSDYAGDYEIVPDGKRIVPERITPRAVMPGPQTAVVTGCGGAPCDQYGRVEVQFHWADGEEGNSMPCRVSQSWASDRYGAFVLPRAGMEVIVEFVDGDPDRPIVTGCVYNGKNMPPYALPEHASRSTFRTRSVTARGEEKGTNELRFEDKAGWEEIYVRAEKDLREFVLNDRTRQVGHNALDTVRRDHVSEVKRNLHHVIGNAVLMEVGHGKGETLADGADEDVREVRDASVTGAPGDMEMRIANDVEMTIGGKEVRKVGATFEETIGESATIDVGTTLDVAAGQSVSIDAPAEIKFTCGASKIVMTPAGITIEAPQVSVNGKAMVKVESGALVAVQAKVVKLN